MSQPHNLIIYEDQATAPPCACTQAGCTCHDEPAVFQNKKGIDLCGCCVADCPDVHPQEVG